MGGPRGPEPQASHQQGASHQTLHIVGRPTCIILLLTSLAFLIFTVSHLVAQSELGPGPPPAKSGPVDVGTTSSQSPVEGDGQLAYDALLRLTTIRSLGLTPMLMQSLRL